MHSENTGAERSPVRVLHKGAGITPAHLEIDREALAELCRRHHIRTLALFGSVLREDFGPDSDVDVLVTFAENHVPGFLGLTEIELQLSGLLGGRRVDVITPKFLNPRIRDRVLQDAEVQHRRGQLLEALDCSAFSRS